MKRVPKGYVAKDGSLDLEFRDWTGDSEGSWRATTTPTTGGRMQPRVVKVSTVAPKALIASTADSASSATATVDAAAIADAAATITDTVDIPLSHPLTTTAVAATGAGGVAPAAVYDPGLPAPPLGCEWDDVQHWNAKVQDAMTSTTVSTATVSISGSHSESLGIGLSWSGAFGSFSASGSESRTVGYGISPAAVSGNYMWRSTMTYMKAPRCAWFKGSVGSRTAWPRFPCAPQPASTGSL